MSSQLIVLLFVVVVIAVCGFLLYAFARIFIAMWHHNRRLAREGAHVEGEVIDREQTIGREGAPMCYITYRYRAPTPDGEKEFTRKDQVWFTHYDNYQIGTKVWVTYLPDKPEVAMRSEKVVG